MNVKATIRNGSGLNEITLITDNSKSSLNIPAKPGGRGSSASGGELLFLAIATCFCNDIYREAPGMGVHVTAVEVSVSGIFPRAGEPGEHIRYHVKVDAPGSPESKIHELIEYVDSIAEIHNSLRKGVGVALDL